MVAAKVISSVNPNQPRIFAERDLIFVKSRSGLGFAVGFGAVCFRLNFLGGTTELIAHAADGFDKRAIGLELPAEMADVHVDRPVEWRGFAIVHALHERVARDNAAGRAHQRVQNVELERGHLNGPLVAENLARPRVDHDAVYLNPAPGGDLNAAQDGPDAGQKLA